jgi:hypothetical protein
MRFYLDLWSPLAASQMGTVLLPRWRAAPAAIELELASAPIIYAKKVSRAGRHAGWPLFRYLRTVR